MTPPDPLRYRIHPSPVGDILIVATADGIVTLHPFDGTPEGELESTALRLRAVPLPDDPEADADVAAMIAAATGQLDEYFDGERRAFDLTLDWRLVRGFRRAALEAVRDIPYGETAGYGEIAITAGSPGAARAVGTACATTPFSIIVPVHRVVRSDGSIGDYGGRADVKRYLIDLERVQGV